MKGDRATAKAKPQPRGAVAKKRKVKGGKPRASRPQADHAPLELVEQDGEVTLFLSGAQAMQAWETELMCASADILCTYGSEFLEVGLGLGISALRIAQAPTTRRHVVIEKYPQVETWFRERHAVPPNLEIVIADFFEYVETIKPESLDGIFFDPALPMKMWNDEALWKRVTPLIVRSIRPGGCFVPFFSTRPTLREQFYPYFNRVIIERRPFQAYEGTMYTYGTSGDAFIQCYVKTR